MAAAVTGPGFISAIGVKPLDVIGADALGGTIAAGLAEEITAHLTRVKRLKVVSRTSMEYASRQRWSSRTIADSLGIRYLLEGSVQRAGPDAVVTLQLIDALNEGHLWAESFRMPVRNVLMVREDIARKALLALAERVQGMPPAETDSSSTNLEAVEAVARGRELVGRAVPAELDEAVQSFQHALDLDPKFAKAAAGISDALQSYVALGLPGREPFKTLALALEWADRAVMLDPNLAEAWSARAMARISARAKPETVLADLDRAVGLKPSSGAIRVYRGLALAYLGRYDDALKEAALGAELDPLNASVRGGGYAITALGARQYDVAIREARLAQRRDPFVGWRVVEGIGHYLKGEPQRCVDLKLTDIGVPFAATCLWKVGRADEAKRIIDSETAGVEARHYAGIYALVFVASYHAQLGNAAEAVRWLDRAFALSPSAADFRFIDSGLMDPIRNDPVFVKGMAAIWARVRSRFF